MSRPELVPELVSVLIPTRNRPEMLITCVRAALGQTYADVEVVVSDDSGSPATEEALRRAALLQRVRYVRNDPPLGQARNVGRLFALARGSRSLLIHDDDWLVETAVERLTACWSAETTVAYGLQHVATDDGVIDPSLSTAVNAQYRRTPDRRGRQPEPRVSAFVGQIPNDGYLVRTDAAREVGYRDDPEVSHACDLDFGLRLARWGGDWQLVDEWTSVYRLSSESVGRGVGGASSADADFRLLSAYDLPPGFEAERTERLRRVAPHAVLHWVLGGRRRQALRVVRSGLLGPLRELSRRDVALVVMLVLPRAVNRRIARRW